MIASVQRSSLLDFEANSSINRQRQVDSDFFVKLTLIITVISTIALNVILDISGNYFVSIASSIFSFYFTLHDLSEISQGKDELLNFVVATAISCFKTGLLSRTLAYELGSSPNLALMGGVVEQISVPVILVSVVFLFENFFGNP